jgi:hypothetical protein
MASPQPDYFVRFSKELFDAAVRAGLPATQLQVFLAVVRRTYGDRGKRTAPVSIGYLVAATGRARSGVKAAYADLLEQGVLLEVTPAKFSAARVVAVQKDYEKWGAYRVDPADIPEYLRRDWQLSTEGQKREQGQESEQGHESRPHGVMGLNPPGPAQRTDPGQQDEPFQDKTLKTRLPTSVGAGIRGGGTAGSRRKGDAPSSFRQTTCDGKPSADCRALTARAGDAVRVAVETVVGRSAAGTIRDAESRLGRSVARLCERTCDLCQVEYATLPRPARDEQCALAVGQAFADVAAYHATHGIKHLPAFLDARTSKAENLHDLLGSSATSSIRRCRECGVDLTFDEDGEHCPVCGQRTSAA